MVQQYKPAYPAEFRQQIVELVAAGRSPTQLASRSRNIPLSPMITGAGGEIGN